MENYFIIRTCYARQSNFDIPQYRKYIIKYRENDLNLCRSR
jgi:hypothetical protein